MDTNRRVRVGQRVWVTYDGGRAFGQVAAIPSPSERLHWFRRAAR